MLGSGTETFALLHEAELADLFHAPKYVYVFNISIKTMTLGYYMCTKEGFTGTVLFLFVLFQKIV